jgi:hypothetical protein
VIGPSWLRSFQIGPLLVGILNCLQVPVEVVAESHFHDVKTRFPEKEDIAWRKKQLKEHFLKFEGENYAESHKEVFIQLKERSTITQLYSAIREVFGPEEEYGFFLNSGLAIEILEDCVRLNDLPAEFVKCYMNDSDVAAIRRGEQEAPATWAGKSLRILRNVDCCQSLRAMQCRSA